MNAALFLRSPDAAQRVHSVSLAQVFTMPVRSSSSSGGGRHRGR